MKKYSCELYDKFKCVEDKKGELTLEECNEVCPYEHKLAVPLYAETNIAYSPFWWTINKLRGVKIQIRYPFPADYADLLISKKGTLYEEFIKFAENDNNEMESTFGFIAQTSYDDWRFINTRLFGDINTYDYPLNPRKFDESDLGELDSSKIMHEDPVIFHSYRWYMDNRPWIRDPDRLSDYYSFMMMERGIFLNPLSRSVKMQKRAFKKFPKWFKGALSNNSMSIINIVAGVVPGHMPIAHANMMIVDPANKRLYYAEPHAKKYNRVLAFQHGINTVFGEELEGWKWEFNQVKLQGDDNFCASWTSLCLAITLKNPSMDGTAFMFDMLLDKNKRFKLSLLVIWVFYISKMTKQWIKEESEINIEEHLEESFKRYTLELDEEDRKEMEDDPSVMAGEKKMFDASEREKVFKITELMKAAKAAVGNNLVYIQDKSFVAWIKEFDMGVALS